MPSYINVDELERAGIGQDAMSRFDEEQKLAAIEMASSEADAYLGRVVTVPLDLLKVPPVVKLMIARMATYYVFSANGFSLAGDDAIVRDNYDLALAFFRDVSRGNVTLGPDLAPPAQGLDPVLDGPYIASDEDRGFSTRGI